MRDYLSLHRIHELVRHVQALKQKIEKSYVGLIERLPGIGYRLTFPRHRTSSTKDLIRPAISSRMRCNTARRSSAEPWAAAGSSKLQCN